MDLAEVERREVARARLKSAVQKAQRTSVAFPHEFIKADDGRPPLARLVHGGRGGAVRLRLYLCITMMATSAPYDLQRPPTGSTWCRLLGLPEDGGPRRVTSNLKWLADARLISLTRRWGGPPAITLLDPAGTGAPYVRPLGRYVGVPAELWENGWLLDLSPTALALLLVLLERQGGQSEPQYVTRHRRDLYGLSPDTWTKARKELEGQGLLTVRRVPQGSDFDYQRLRNTYWVELSRLKLPSTPLGSPV
ncbi:hypothetical protein ACFVUY_03775 [Kitasatospora sp. NPDC058063]|uniref:hypothetical protein n=1 Tax=unclassified Kitasatospora TaxID=2633591 RepID=UPI0036DD4577